MLSIDQQARFARHLLLDGLEGEGQERLVAGAAAVELPAEWAVVARWAVRYLAASGVGMLALRGAWAEEAARECAALWPAVRVDLAGPVPPSLVRVIPAAGSVGPGAAIAAAVAAAVGGAGEGTPALEAAEAPVARSEVRVDARDLSGPAAASLGARVALEVLKLLAGIGKQCETPLRGPVPGALGTSASEGPAAKQAGQA